jgi:hypothetical protein
MLLFQVLGRLQMVRAAKEVPRSRPGIGVELQRNPSRYGVRTQSSSYSWSNLKQKMPKSRNELKLRVEITQDENDLSLKQNYDPSCQSLAWRSVYMNRDFLVAPCRMTQLEPSRVCRAANLLFL